MPISTCPACGAQLPSDRRCDSCDLQHAQPRLIGRRQPGRGALTIIRSELPDGTVEWAALSAERQHHRHLRDAGFSYDRSRRLWRSEFEPEVAALVGLRAVFVAGQGSELACVA